MEHSHNHQAHNTVPTDMKNAYIIGIGLNLAYVIVQIIVGLRINSLSILSDAGHNFLDVGGLALSLVAIKLNATKTSDKYSYGYKKASILIALLNAVILLLSIGAIGYEAIFRFQTPEPLPGKTIAMLAAVGIVINGGSALMFLKNKEQDVNVKSAFLHLASDALVSLGLVIGGIIIYFTQWYWIDPLLSIIVCIIIIASTWSLLKSSLRLSLDGVPDGLNVETIKDILLKENGILNVHHIHVWAISTTQNALTAHIVVSSKVSSLAIETLKNKCKHCLADLNIAHATLEVEIENTLCESNEC